MFVLLSGCFWSLSLIVCSQLLFGSITCVGALTFEGDIMCVIYTNYLRTERKKSQREYC